MTMAAKKSDGVLIVEDDMILAMVIEQMLRQLGYNVKGKVKKGEEAVRAALHDPPGVILMDIRLDGDMDGIEAVKKIHSSTDIPVIYITGNNDAHSRERANQTTHSEFLVKPINQSTLNRALQQASAGKVTSGY
jgi:CheY-like chemotaxis protein